MNKKALEERGSLSAVAPLRHIALRRLFAPVDKDKEIPLETPSAWGRKLYGYKDWSELLRVPRVVLLAEAGSGKTEEFKAQCRTLHKEGKYSFFVRVEDLVDVGLDASLDSDDADQLREWLRGVDTAYFFVDSVDEARLNHKSFETALRRLARELGQGLARAHILVSCRISDWKGQADYAAIERLLPLPRTTTPVSPPDPDGALLKPIFEKLEKKSDLDEKLVQLLIVRLVSLSDADRRALATGSGVPNPDDFLGAIERQGLSILSDRPADLLELAEYWKSHGAFGSLATMTEYSVRLKLAEHDPSRPDNSVMTMDKALHGAQRVAAALTLGHTFTMRAPNQEPDPTLAAGALDVKDILPDWSDGERAALLRRGVFAPATYGRVRFHHRGTQEYLAAQWFDRLLKCGCDRRSVMDLLFASRYGTKTVVPSLRTEAAWLALWHDDICAELVRREPTTLIQAGDPASLPLSVRRDLLLRYADLHQNGDISDDRLDGRALWLFSHGDLGGAVTAAWKANTRESFRIHALRIIRDAKLAHCQPLWREILKQPADMNSRDYLRAVALEAAKACSDTQALDEAAANLVANPGSFGEVTAARMVEVLFPQHVTVAQVLELVAGSKAAPGNSVSGFAYALDRIFPACRNRDERTALLGGLADLALAPPFTDDYSGLSRRHQRIAEHLVPLVMQAIDETGSAQPSHELIRALMAIERCDRYHRHDDAEKLAESVRSRPLVNQALLWADVDGATDLVPKRPGRPKSIHQIHLYGGSLWGFGIDDLSWLISDIKSRRLLSDRRMALGITVGVLVRTGEWETRRTELAYAVKGHVELERELLELSTPTSPSPAMERMAIRESIYRKKREAEEEKAKSSWRNFRTELQSNPGRISDPVRLAPPDPMGFGDLQNLTRWLCSHTGEAAEERAVLHWRALEGGFGSAAVAEAYRNGMMQFWRVIEPRWPERTEGGPVTIYFVTEIAHAGVHLEAAADVNWAKKLSPAEAAKATDLACRSGNSRPAWLDDLVKAHPATTLPALYKTLTCEWTTKNDDQRRFLYDYAHASEELQHDVRDLLIDIVLGERDPSARAAELGVRIIQKNRTWVNKVRLAQVANARFDDAIKCGDPELVPINFALLILADPKAGVERLRAWITDAPEPETRQRAVLMLAKLFGRDHALVPAELDAIAIDDLYALAKLAYTQVSPLDDIEHQGTFTPGLRDDAQSARSAILSAIIDRTGPDAYAALIQLGSSGIAGICQIRFRELARRKAERDAEIVPWTPAEVVAFETTSLLPIKNADNLYAVVLRVLNDVRQDSMHEDVSSRQLLQTVAQEEYVQGWLAEQLKLRARDRYHVHREPEVADKKEPDIVTSAVAIPAQVAIEIKHANKGWTVRELEDALTMQLAEQYLRPANRRHGVLVITMHTPRTWRNPDGNSVLSFAQVIDRLSELARKVTRNTTGTLEVRVVGIDVT